ncbi:MAG: SHOCT domain-containing protein [Sulfuricella sp.]
MKRILSLMFLSLALASTNANAWFFFFLPGSVTGAITDAVTGSEGSNCVGENAKVGDVIRLPGGAQGIIKSLSGTSMRCTQPEFPIRALIDTSSASSPPVQAPTTKLNLGTPSLSRQVGESCRNKFECSGTLGCENGKCVPTQEDLLKPKLGKGATCNNTVECDGNMYCIESRCIITSETPAGGACWVRAECSGSLVCESGKCAPPNDALVVQPIMPAPVVATVEDSSLKVPQSQNSGAMQRLKDLKALYKEGLITQKDYETKKQEILKSM